MRRLFAPEVVQSSALDCGPAALKSLLGGFGIPVSYGRLREACQTGLDGSSIDTLESVANLLGLEAEQIMLPQDHVLLPAAQTLPAIAVITVPGGLTHFVVVWRRHGSWLQVMDPAVGRRWVRIANFEREFYQHTAVVPAAGWREFAGSTEFQDALLSRLQQIGIGKADAAKLRFEANQDPPWGGLGRLDAATRAVLALKDGRLLRSPSDAATGVRSLMAQPEAIPEQFWSVRSAGQDETGEPQVQFRGAILLRALRRRPGVASQPLPSELAAIVAEPSSPAPLRELWRLLRPRDRLASFFLLAAVPLAVAGLLLEALLFRCLFDVSSQLHLAGQRVGAIAALVSFGLLLLFLEFATFLGSTRICRQLELRLRMAFLRKVPLLGDRYFQSRLISDMGERSHALQRLRNLPELVRRTLATLTELLATGAGMVWLEPATAPFVVFTVAAAMIPALLSRSLLAERDLRMRSHSAGLTRFYLDAIRGFASIRAHGAADNLRHAHGELLAEWVSSALRLQHVVVILEAVQSTATFGAIALMLLMHPLRGANAGQLLLVAYWALNIPVLGQTLGALARQYPQYRSLTLRACEPLGAPEEGASAAADVVPYAQPPSIHYQAVSAEASGQPILNEVTLDIEAGSHVAVLGQSGAGKSSLIGMLLGWLPLKEGGIRIDDSPLDVNRLRASAVWIDPAIQLWNRSLYDNLRYGSEADAAQVGEALEAAHLRAVLDDLPGGLQASLGESGARLSGGEGQRVRLGRGILRHSPQIVLLDEPFRGLDREMRSRLLREARARWRYCTLLCATHDVAETQAFDRVILMKGGRIVEEGAPDELASRRDSRYSELLRAERDVRSWIWNRRPWRRIRVAGGTVAESTVPATAESEVA